MEAIGTAVLVALLVYFLYEGVTWLYAVKYPPAPYKDEDPVLGKIATVSREFSGSDSSSTRTGSVELNGTTWEAESFFVDQNLDVGDRCRVTGRDGLKLIVEAEN